MKSESEVAQSCPTLSDRMDLLEWGAIAFSGQVSSNRINQFL